MISQRRGERRDRGARQHSAFDLVDHEVIGRRAPVDHRRPEAPGRVDGRNEREPGREERDRTVAV